MVTHFLREARHPDEHDEWMVQMPEREYNATVGLIGALALIAWSDDTVAKRRVRMDEAVATHIATPVIVPTPRTEAEWTPPPDASAR